MANSVWISWYGAVRVVNDGSTVEWSGNIATTGQFIGPAADNTSAPPFTFSGDRTTGVASPAAGTVAVVSSGTTLAKFASTQSGTSEDSNLFRFEGTLNAVNTAIPNGVFFNVTSAGTSNFSQRAMQVVLQAGYTGDRSTVGFASDNRALGTGADGFFGFCNIGASFQTLGNGTGDKVGVLASAARSSVRNIGAVCQATFAPNSPQHQIGLAAFALNGSSTNIAGYFGLQGTAPTLGFNSALVADNGAVAAPIATFRDNGTTVVSIDDGGTLTLVGGATAFATRAALTNGAAAQTGTLTNAPAAGNPTKWIAINDNGTTRHIPAW